MTSLAHQALFRFRLGFRFPNGRNDLINVQWRFGGLGRIDDLIDSDLGVTALIEQSPSSLQDSLTCIGFSWHETTINRPTCL